MATPEEKTVPPVGGEPEKVRMKFAFLASKPDQSSWTWHCRCGSFELSGGWPALPILTSPLLPAPATATPATAMDADAARRPHAAILATRFVQVRRPRDRPDMTSTPQCRLGHGDARSRWPACGLRSIDREEKERRRQ